MKTKKDMQICTFECFPPIEFAFREIKCHILFGIFLQVLKKTTESFMKKMQRLVLEKSWSVFQEQKQTTSTFWSYRLLKIAMPGFFSETETLNHSFQSKTVD